MRSVENSSRRETWLSVALIILVTLLTNAPLISQLGFYRDDWYLMWVAQYQGSEGIIALFRGDRPLFGWFYALDYLLLGDAPLGWHLLGLFIKLITALGTLWLLRSLWPQHKLETTVMTLLYVVYPGFFQQPNVGTFMNHFMAYAAAILSLACTVQALKATRFSSKAIYAFFGLILAAFYIFTYEALIGTEAVRLLLIGYFYYRQNGSGWKSIIRKTLIQLYPYILLTIGFGVWRLFFFQATRRSTRVDVLVDEYLTFPLHNAARLIFETLKDIFETTLLAWGVPFYQFTVRADYRVLVQAMGLALVVVLFAAVYWFLLRRQVQTESDVSPSNVERDWMVLGILSVICTTIPVVAAGRDIFFASQWDRYTFQSILGAALFAGGLIFHMRGRIRWVFLAGLLISGVVTQYFSAADYRDFWRVQREAWWQLAWRAPQIQDGTTLVVASLGGYQLPEEYEVWGPVNMIYRPGRELTIPGQVLFSDIWIDLANEEKENRAVRGTVRVPRDYGRVVILSQPTQGDCLHLLDPAHPEQWISESPQVQSIAQYSDIGLIDTTEAGGVPPVEVFGAEPEHGWCYYFQKLELARQRGDWQTAAALADEALDRELLPAQIAEWLPLLDAYVHVGDLDKTDLIIKEMREDKRAHLGLCTHLKALNAQSGEVDPRFDLICSND